MAFDDLLSDEEREEQLRNWWRDNWAWLLSGIGLGVVLLVGWRYWTGQQEQTAAAAARLYQELTTASGRNDFGTMERVHGQLTSEYGSTPYADQGALLLARMYVETGEFDKAATALRGVMETSADEELRTIARLRLARVLLQQDKADEALALLPAAADGAFSGYEHELRGDALHAKGDIPGARSEYAAALTAGTEFAPADRELIQLKLQDLEATEAPPATTQEAVQP